MANNFQGYLFKAVATNTPFPNRYIEFKTWSSTPKQREEIKAYRDDNTRALTRVTASGKKSVFSFNVRQGLHLEDKIALLKFFTDAETSAVERKIQLQYWNEESNNYDTGYFYRPNMPFKIIRIENDDIIYDTLKLEFIEY